MAWDNTVITNKGLEMLRQAIDGGELAIVSASGSDETYPAASLMGQTVPVNEKQTFNITEIRDMDNGIRVRVTITNDGLTKGYVMKQMCLWARINENETPQIIAISQDELGTAIPAEGEIASYLMQFYVLLKIDTATNMKIVVENSAFVTLDVVEELLKNKADLVNGKLPTNQLMLDNKPREGSSNPISSGAAKAALDKKQNTEDAFSGDYNDLDNKPLSFPPKKHTHSFDSLSNRPENYPPSAHTHPYIPTSEKGQANGVAGLNKDGKVFEEQLPEMDFYSRNSIINSTIRTIYGLPLDSIPSDLFQKLGKAVFIETVGSTPLRTRVTVGSLPIGSRIFNADETEICKKIAGSHFKSGTSTFWSYDSAGYGKFNRYYHSYRGSYVDTECENTYYNKLPTYLKNHIVPVNIKYYDTDTPTTAEIKTITRKCFALSSTELLNYNFDAAEGSFISYFSNKENRNYNSNNVWTRTAHVLWSGDLRNYWQGVQLNEDLDKERVNFDYHGAYKPAFNLTNDMVLYRDAIGRYFLEQEYQDPRDILVDVKGKAVNYADIEMGSYKGTGTYGESNPNSLALSENTKIININRFPSSSYAAMEQQYISIPIYLLTSSYKELSVYGEGSRKILIHAKIQNNVFVWYANTASNQLNSSGMLYEYWTLIG